MKPLKKNSFLFYIFISTVLFGQAQTKNIDKYRVNYQKYFSSNPDSSYFYLIKLIKNHSNEPDTIRAKDYNNASIYYKYKNQKDSAIYFLQKSLQLATPKNKIDTQINIANVYKKYNENNKASELLTSLLKNKLTTTSQKGGIHADLASIYSINEDFNKAKHHFTLAIKILKQTNSLNTLAICEINFANFYKTNDLAELAIPLYISSSHFFFQNKNYRNYYVALINLISCYYSLNDINKAKKSLQEVNKKQFLKLGDLWLISSYYNLKANIYSLDESTKIQHDSINYFYNKSIETGLEVNTNQNLLLINDYLNYRLNKKDTIGLKEELKKYNTEEIFKKANLLLKADFLTTIIDYEYKNVLTKNYNLKDLIIYRDSLMAKNRSVIKNELLSKNSILVEKEKNIVSIKKDNTKRIITFFIISIVVIAIFVFMYVKKIKQSKKNKIELKNKLEKLKINATQTNASLTRRIIDLNHSNSNLRDHLKEFYQDNPKEDEKNIYQKNFLIKFNEFNSDFVAYFNKNYKNLTSSDLHLCILIKLNFSNKEIGQILNLQYNSVIVKKRRLKAKLNLDKEQKIESFILDIN